MAIKMNTNFQATSSFGPGNSYYEAQARFQSILEQKLNVKPSTGVLSTRLNKGAYGVDQGYMPTDVTKLSNASKEVIDEKLKGTAMEGMGADFVAAEQKYGVNAWFLTGLAIHESGFGTSRIAKDKNNLFGFTAYDSNPYSNATGFANKEDSVDTVAKYLSENYLNPQGKYYNGVAASDVGKRYATDPNWASAINRRIQELMK